MIVPDSLSGQVPVLGLELSRYRLLLIAVGIAVTLALVFGLERTRFGARIRASVDRQRTAEAMGIHVGRVFQLTLAIGCGLAGLGGALGVNVLGLDPYFPLKTLVYFLLVVVVGGAGSVPARCSPPCCSASRTPPASTTCPKPARSSSTRPWWCCSCCSRAGCWGAGGSA